MLRYLPLFFLIATATSSASTEVGDSPMVVYKASDEYAFVRENLEMAIIDHGLLISGVLHISDMLERTGKDLGFEKKIYLKAESIEFCSASMTYRMTAADPRNIAICPFTIAVYVKADEPDQVYVVFQRPRLVGDSRAVENAAFKLLDDIAREALE